ncbi:hypothetical protein ILUMI_06005 [Ignelater luminosus]|uniref:Protein MMS22-like n=1 Tax=Ignelater luminosus TaxID=2038154 RepID=A0A8K0D691_IGNLU|nr:hypothetical protein ILUMI_06005 [Ignelater luminosus]
MYLKCNCKNKTSAIKEDLETDVGSELCYNPNFDNNASCVIDGRTFQSSLIILEVDKLFNICRKQWRQIEDVVFTEGSCRNVNVSEFRKEIVDVLSCCRYSVNWCSEDAQYQELLQNKLLSHVRLLQNTITPWSELETASLLKLTSLSVTDSMVPMYHYFHMYIDVQWLLLSLKYTCKVPLENYDGLMKDLITFSDAFYKKQDPKDVVKVNAFICPCIKRLWLLLQLLNEKLCIANPRNKKFWDIFNELLKDHDEEFSIWLLYSVSILQGYDGNGKFTGLLNPRIQENQILIDQKLKLLNNKCTNVINNNQNLLNCCKLINELLNKWWTDNTKLESYQILWEIFNKHINVCFDINKTNSAAEFIQIVDNIITCSNTNNSYEYFLHMLNKYLINFPNQWPRIRGRIYCKLPSHKINEFSDTGLCNISLLFLSLIRTVDMKEISEKLLSLLLNLKTERLNNPTIINVYMSLIILYIRQGYKIKEISMQLVELVERYSANREMFHLIRSYMDGFDAVLNASENFNLEQHLLLGSWLHKYLAHCQYSDLCYFLNVLVCNIKRIRNAGAWCDWENVLRDHVLPRLKTVAMKENAPVQVGELAALITLNPTSEWVLTFTADPVSPKVVCHFLCTLLEDVAENFVMPEHHKTAILHAWTRCCLLNCDDKEKLTRNVMKIRPLSNMNIEIDFTDKPLISFVKLLGTINSKFVNLRELCEQCFGRLDSWIINPYLKSPQSESLVVHIYTCIALLFYHSSSLLYQKNRSSCLLNRLISIFLLSNDILTGKAPHPYVLGAIQRTWHCFVQGIFFLDSNNDAYLERILRDMIVHYVPILSLTNCPILKCNKDPRLFTLLLEKLSGAFLSCSARSSDGNTTKAIKIITLAIENSNSVEDTKLILKCILTPILEVIVFHVHKNAAVDFIKFITSNENYVELKESMNKSIIAVTEKHLAFSTNNYFQFVNILAKIIPSNLRAILPNIKKHIVSVEVMRGVGYDNTLRQGLDKLERLLG